MDGFNFSERQVFYGKHFLCRYLHHMCLRLLTSRLFNYVPIQAFIHTIHLKYFAFSTSSLHRYSIQFIMLFIEFSLHFINNSIIHVANLCNHQNVITLLATQSDIIIIDNVELLALWTSVIVIRKDTAAIKKTFNLREEKRSTYRNNNIYNIS